MGRLWARLAKVASHAGRRGPAHAPFDLIGHIERQMAWFLGEGPEPEPRPRPAWLTMAEWDAQVQVCRAAGLFVRGEYATGDRLPGMTDDEVRRAAGYCGILARVDEWFPLTVGTEPPTD
jgi:hypothetical protein